MGKLQQQILGVIAIATVAVTATALLLGSTQPLFSIGLRAGLVLLAIWIAWPQLQRGEWKASLVVGLIAIGIVVFLAARPKSLPIVAIVLIGLFIVHVIFRNAIKFLGSNRQ